MNIREQVCSVTIKLTMIAFVVARFNSSWFNFIFGKMVESQSRLIQSMQLSYLQHWNSKKKSIAHKLLKAKVQLIRVFPPTLTSTDWIKSVKRAAAWKPPSSISFPTFIQQKKLNNKKKIQKWLVSIESNRSAIDDDFDFLFLKGGEVADELVELELNWKPLILFFFCRPNHKEISFVASARPAQINALFNQFPLSINTILTRVIGVK